jgi:hypothetical protein
MRGHLPPSEIYQLAGYLLLDYDHRFCINRVSLYLSRHGALITWNVGAASESVGSYVGPSGPH